MSEHRSDSPIPEADPAIDDAEQREPSTAAPVVAADDLAVEDEPNRRSDLLAAGVAVLVLVALISCAALVLIAAGNG